MSCRFLRFFILSSSVFCAMQSYAQSRLPRIVLCTEAPIPLDKNESVAGYLQWQNQATDAISGCQNTQGWSQMRVHYRGNSSMKYAKKQYSLSFVDDHGGKAKVALGNFPKAEKWVLRSTYVDRSFLRDTFVYELGRRLAASRGDSYGAPRTQLVEIIENDQYQGIYVLTEKIARAEDRVSLSVFDANNPKAMTYIMQLSCGDGHFKTRYGTSIKYVDPTEKKLSKLQKSDDPSVALVQDTMKTQIEAFEEALKSKDFDDPDYGYKPYIDEASFVDYFLIQELTKNFDGFRRSVYFYRSEDAKFHMGPLWDFDITLGNLLLFGMGRPEGWSYKKQRHILQKTFWFRRMLQDKSFAHAVRERYQKLRQSGNLLDWNLLEKELDHLKDSLGDAPDRDRLRWEGTQPFRVRHIIRTKQKSENFEGNVRILKDWLQARLLWLDKAIAKETF